MIFPYKICLFKLDKKSEMEGVKKKKKKKPEPCSFTS